MPYLGFRKKGMYIWMRIYRKCPCIHSVVQHAEFDQQCIKSEACVFKTAT